MINSYTTILDDKADLIRVYHTAFLFSFFFFFFFGLGLRLLNVCVCCCCTVTYLPNCLSSTVAHMYNYEIINK